MKVKDLPPHWTKRDIDGWKTLLDLHGDPNDCPRCGPEYTCPHHVGMFAYAVRRDPQLSLEDVGIEQLPDGTLRMEEEEDDGQETSG